MNSKDKYTKEMKILVDEILNVTEMLSVVRKDWLPDNKNGKNDDKIKSMLNILCKSCRTLEAKARSVKQQIKKAEGPEFEYDI